MERMGTQNAESARIGELIDSASCLWARIGLEGTLQWGCIRTGPLGCTSLLLVSLVGDSYKDRQLHVALYQLKWHMFLYSSHL